jgi:hypothetical protein
MWVIVYNEKKDILAIAEDSWHRENRFRKIEIISQNTDRVFTKREYLSEKSWQIICKFE